MFDPKDPEEEITITFDYSAAGDSVSDPDVSVRLIKGIDPNPSAILSGAPVISGAYVLQKVIGGISGCDYQLRCLADVENARPIIIKVLPVRSGCS